MAGYFAPAQSGEGIGRLGRGGAAVLAGGTDFYPARLGRPPTEDVLDITGSRKLRRIEITPGQVRIGACVTWSELLQADLPRAFDGLKLAAREIGGIQIQNTADLAGNVCNASPAADGTPNLLALDAEVELSSLEGRRLVTHRRIRHRQSQDLPAPRRIGDRTGGAVLRDGCSQRFCEARRAEVSGHLHRDDRVGHRDQGEAGRAGRHRHWRLFGNRLPAFQRSRRNWRDVRSIALWPRRCEPSIFLP